MDSPTHSNILMISEKDRWILSLGRVFIWGFY